MSSVHLQDYSQLLHVGGVSVNRIELGWKLTLLTWQWMRNKMQVIFSSHDNRMWDVLGDLTKQKSLRRRVNQRLATVQLAEAVIVCHHSEWHTGRSRQPGVWRPWILPVPFRVISSWREKRAAQLHKREPCEIIDADGTCELCVIYTKYFISLLTCV